MGANSGLGKRPTAPGQQGLDSDLCLLSGGDPQLWINQQGWTQCSGHRTEMLREGPAIGRWGNVLGYDRDIPVGSGPDTLIKLPAVRMRSWARLRWQADPMNWFYSIRENRDLPSTLLPLLKFSFCYFWGKKIGSLSTPASELSPLAPGFWPCPWCSQLTLPPVLFFSFNIGV